MARRPDRRISAARRLRREATYQERLVWNAIRQFDIVGFHPRRQATTGPYIVDFACHHLKIVIEIDGDHHAYGQQLERDERRDAYLSARGYRVLRISNQHIAESLDGAIETVFAACLEQSASLPPTPDPSPPQAGGGENARPASKPPPDAGLQHERTANATSETNRGS
jgi:very-short-patch-repair endonuclease